MTKMKLIENSGSATRSSRAFAQLKTAVDMMIEAMEELSVNRVGEIEDYEPESNNLTLLFQDVALLKDFRQPIAQVDESTRPDDCPAPTGCRTPFHTLHRSEWRIQRSYTPTDSIFEFCIALSHGVIEEPTGHEFRT